MLLYPVGLLLGHGGEGVVGAGRVDAALAAEVGGVLRPRHQLGHLGLGGGAGSLLR